MTATPKISVIIPTYNRAALLPRAVGSVLAQTYADFELLIVDDCSTDDTPAVIAGFTDSRVRSLRQDTNRGRSAARNTGIGAARGEFLAFLDSDDEFTPTSLADRLAVFESAPPEVALVYGWMYVVDDTTGEKWPNRFAELEGEAAFNHALEAKEIAPTSALLVRTSAAKSVGGFDERLAAAEDQYFIFCILSKYEIRTLREFTFIYHQNHGINESVYFSDYRSVYYRLHLELFSSELEKHPNLYVDMLWRAADYSMAIREFKPAASLTFKAFVFKPLMRSNIRRFLRLGKTFFWHYTPLRYYRERVKHLLRRLGLRKG